MQKDWRGVIATATPEAVLAGRRLKVAREAQRLNLQDVARQVGLTHQHLSKIERGVANTTITTLARVAAVYGLRLADLFGDPSEGGRDRDDPVLPVSPRHMLALYSEIKEEQRHVARKMEELEDLLLKQPQDSGPEHYDLRTMIVAVA
jgi:transcriptional regulator with XRE-family HTH domain